jgi:hypothetical protein
MYIHNQKKELARQIQQEREQDKLDRISGKKIDWMYQGGTPGDLAKEDAERKAEEFLMGKEFAAEGAAVGDFDNGDQKQGIHKVVACQQAAEAAHNDDTAVTHVDLEPSVKDRNETFCLRVEDPMFLVSQNHREKVVKHEQTKALYECVVSPTTGDDPDEDEWKKSSKKE